MFLRLSGSLRDVYTLNGGQGFFYVIVRMEIVQIVSQGDVNAEKNIFM